MNPIALTILTPTGRLSYDDGDLVVLRTKHGYEGFMARHIPTMVEIVPSVLRYRVPSTADHPMQWRALFVSVGYAEVMRDRVIVVVNAAELPDEIDKARAERARDRALRRLSRPEATEREKNHARHALRRADARLEFCHYLAERQGS